MATEEWGRIEVVPIREAWPNEAADFTPWLADNLELLGDALGMELVYEGKEVAVGKYSLDLLAKETERGAFVAIENQLYPTDHTHLGQLLTYAAAHDARILIWVAPFWNVEHRDTLTWLNRWMPDDMEIYGVEVRAIKIGGSRRAPEFRVVVGDSAQIKRTRRATGRRPRELSDLTQTELRYHEFYQPLMDEMRRRGIYASRANQPYSHYEYGVGSSASRAGYYMVGFYRTNRTAEIYIWIDQGDRETNTRVFEALKEEAEQIERELGDVRLDWTGQPNNRVAAAVSISRSAAIEDPDDHLAEIREWMLEYTPKFKEVVERRLHKIMADVRQDS